MSVVRASGLGAILAARSPAMASSGSEARPGYDTVGDQPAFRKIVRGVFGPHLGVQPHPGGDGRGGGAARDHAASDQPARGRQTLEAFQPVIAMLGEGGAAFRELLYEHLLDAIATHRVADRPDRYEPRRRKREPQAVRSSDEAEMEGETRSAERLSGEVNAAAPAKHTNASRSEYSIISCPCSHFQKITNLSFIVFSQHFEIKHNSLYEKGRRTFFRPPVNLSPEPSQPLGAYYPS